MISFLKKSLKKTTEAIKSVAPKRKEKLTKDELEDILLEADVTYETVEDILLYLPAGDIVKRDDLKRVLLSYFLEIDKKEIKAFTLTL